MSKKEENMGKTLSKARGHLITRPMQRFNIETRTEKLLEKDKPMPAPKFHADIEARQQNLAQNWQKMEKDIRAKDEPLTKRLEDVYVTSEDPEGFDPEINRRRPVNPNRPLPADSYAYQLQKGFGTPEGYQAPSGRITLEATQNMLLDHAKDPQGFNAGALATKYDIKVADAEAIIQSFRVFTFIKGDGKDPLSEQEIENRKNPYLAQPDWVVETGELPPVKDKRVELTLGDGLTIAGKTKEERAKLLGLPAQETPKVITNQSVRSAVNVEKSKKITDK